MPRYVSSQSLTEFPLVIRSASVGQAYTSPRLSTRSPPRGSSPWGGDKLEYRGMVDAPGRGGPATDTSSGGYGPSEGRSVLAAGPPDGRLFRGREVRPQPRLRQCQRLGGVAAYRDRVR